MNRVTTNTLQTRSQKTGPSQRKVSRFFRSIGNNGQFLPGVELPNPLCAGWLHHGRRAGQPAETQLFSAPTPICNSQFAFLNLQSEICNPKPPPLFASLSISVLCLRNCELDRRYEHACRRLGEVDLRTAPNTGGLVDSNGVAEIMSTYTAALDVPSPVETR